MTISGKFTTGDIHSKSLQIADAGTIGSATDADAITIAGDGKTTFSQEITATNGLVGNITGNCSGTAATVTSAAQSAITSVGTLTSLQIADAGTIGSATDADAITIAGDGKTTFSQAMSLSSNLLFGSGSTQWKITPHNSGGVTYLLVCYGDGTCDHTTNQGMWTPP